MEATGTTLCVSQHGPWCLDRPGGQGSLACDSTRRQGARHAQQRSPTPSACRARLHAQRVRSVRALCTRPIRCSALCCALFRSLFGTLFMDIVHGHCSWTLFLSHCSLKNNNNNNNDPRDLGRHIHHSQLPNIVKLNFYVLVKLNFYVLLSLIFFSFFL